MHSTTFLNFLILAKSDINMILLLRRLDIKHLPVSWRDRQKATQLFEVNFRLGQNSCTQLVSWHAMLSKQNRAHRNKKQEMHLVGNAKEKSMFFGLAVKTD